MNLVHQNLNVQMFVLAYLYLRLQKYKYFKLEQVLHDLSPARQPEGELALSAGLECCFPM